MTSDRDSLAEANQSDLPFTVVVPLAGVGVRVESNSPAVTSAFAQRYGVVGAAAQPQCRLTVHVSPGGAQWTRDSEAQWQLPDSDHATVSGPGFSATIDLAAFTATATVDGAFVERHPMFRRDVLEGIPLLLINRRDRHPVHAACVRQGSTAVLLYGPSGTGKSTLAYVAHTAGLDVIADDSTRVQLTPELRIWGESATRFFHLRTSARQQFAELRDLEPDWLSAGGIPKLSVRASPASHAGPPYATVARVCLLARDGGPVARRPASAAEIRDALLNAPESGFNLAPEQLVRVANALAEPGGWHLKLSPNPADAVSLLKEMLAEVSDAQR